MELTVAEKVKLLMGRQNINMTELSNRIGQSRQNLTNKFNRGNFTEKDIEKLATALDCKVEITFVMSNGDRI